MDLQTRKIEFIQEFLKIQSEEVVSQLEMILRKEKEKSNQDDFAPMSMEEFNLRIDESLEDSRKGKLIKTKDLEAEMKKWE